jgi:hypothetical protein
MPHKRPKRSIREQDRSQKCVYHLPLPVTTHQRFQRHGPGAESQLSSELLPKSFARAINAAQVRAAKKAKRRKVEGSVGKAKIINVRLCPREARSESLVIESCRSHRHQRLSGVSSPPPSYNSCFFSAAQPVPQN